MTDYRAMARNAAIAHGLPAARFEAQMGVESVNYAVNVIECRLDSPAGARGIAQLMPVHWSAVDPCDPHAALDYAAGLMRSHLDYWRGQGKDEETAYGLALASYNAGRQATIDGLAGRKAWWPFAETVTYLVRIMGIDDGQARAIMTGGAVPKVKYDPNTPPIAQDDDWSCAPTSLRWALKALGRNPGPNYIEDLLVRDGVVTRESGLLDASGAQLAAWIGKTGPEYYGGDGFYANSEPSVTFDGLALEGDHAYPLLAGGRVWNHWTGVRGYDKARDVLLLANPSEGWGNVYQTMGREQFNALGPFSMIRVLHPDLLEPVPVPAPDPQKAQLLEIAADLRRQADLLEKMAV